MDWVSSDNATAETEYRWVLYGVCGLSFIWGDEGIDQVQESKQLNAKSEIPHQETQRFRHYLGRWCRNSIAVCSSVWVFEDRQVHILMMCVFGIH